MHEGDNIDKREKKHCMNKLTIQNMTDLPFDVEESINQLRVNLSFCGDQMKTIMITSSLPNEGKSFIAIYLWKMMSELGSRTLLVDCDLRKSEMRTKYGISSTEKMTGVSHYLAGKAELKDVLYTTNISNGFFLPLSSPVANPSILLESRRFDGMLKQCRELFDVVLIDTPPVGRVADALKIASHVDGTVMVVHNGQTPRKIVIDSVRQLQRTGTPLLGIVLNRVEMKQKGGYYRRYYYGDYDSN